MCDLYTFKFVSLPIFLLAWVRITDQEIERKQKKITRKRKKKKRFALTKFLFPNVFREKQAFFIIRRWPKIWRVISYPSCDKSGTSIWTQKVKKKNCFKFPDSRCGSVVMLPGPLPLFLRCRTISGTNFPLSGPDQNRKIFNYWKKHYSV